MGAGGFVYSMSDHVAFKCPSAYDDPHPSHSEAMRNLLAAEDLVATPEDPGRDEMLLADCHRFLDKEKLETEKLETEKLETEKLETEKLETEKLETEKLETEKLETEKLETEKLETEKLAP
ncbi:hypothetical protein BJF96_g9818 [Verticillium dahliae]|uniref:Uncharacterized protein n=1 Tax=Verticillium dahliae TaxID=27337 RepID=A0AA45AHI1_VERDA|nr:hypothetical protein BJF96_g9818 [Verticillium dahliae]